MEQLVISGHESQLRQVIRNLINNAIKYTPDKGQICCECRLLRIPAEAAAQRDNDWPDCSTLPLGSWAALQVIDLARRCDDWLVIASDSEYSQPLTVACLDQCEHITGVFRLRRNRKLYRRPGPYSGKGHPC